MSRLCSGIRSTGAKISANWRWGCRGYSIRARLPLMASLLTLVGEVTVQFDPARALSLQLCGQLAGQADSQILVSFPGRDNPQLPATLLGAEITANEAPTAGFVIHSAGRDYLLRAAGIHVHHDLGQRVSRVLPPHTIRWRTRLVWAIGMRLAGIGPIRTLLLRRGS